MKQHYEIFQGTTSLGKIVGDVVRRYGNVRHHGGQQHRVKLLEMSIGEIVNFLLIVIVFIAGSCNNSLCSLLLPPIL